MLVNLHVKNFAIIDEIDVDFNKHLNILTGETGAGKSILVGSVNIALGQRVSADMIRKGAESAMVELVFQIEDNETIQALKKMDIEPEEGMIVISRKIMENRSVNKINGESVPVALIKKAAQLCIDIHGQHEHQSLLNRKKHLEIIDEYMKDELLEKKKKLGQLYKEYFDLKKEWEENEISAEERERQVSFMKFEKNEIEKAKLREGEEEEIEREYRLLCNSEKIVKKITEVYQKTSDSPESAGNQISRAVKELIGISDFNPNLAGLYSQLSDIESLIMDFNRELADYMSDFVFDESDFHRIEERLNQIRSIFSRYGGDYNKVMEYFEQINEKLKHFEEYETYRENSQGKIRALEAELEVLCGEITNIRKKGALLLQKKISDALQDLNFLDARFKVEHRALKQFTVNGKDEMEFVISMNPGEDLKPLGKVASGGELSRIMLAIKSVLADSDNIETLIFDEIDVGISGRTAQKVSEKMAVIGKKHQIICITHLAQIAAMADSHYFIEKVVKEGVTKTDIRKLSDDESVQELARITSGAEVTETVMASAAEMKELASKYKTYSV